MAGDALPAGRGAASAEAVPVRDARGGDGWVCPAVSVGVGGPDGMDVIPDAAGAGNRVPHRPQPLPGRRHRCHQRRRSGSFPWHASYVSR